MLPTILSKILTYLTYLWNGLLWLCNLINRFIGFLLSPFGYLLLVMLFIYILFRRWRG